tara:strand:+ start:21367 stop:22377 length:1011 start_codon:yes stop_codon:yes gene_type:complete
MKMTRIILMLFMAMAGLSSVLADSLPPTPADLPGDPRHRLSVYMERLDSERWLDRETATIDLARDRVVEERVIVERLAQSLMTQEQRLRLLRAIETRLLLLPKGAVGISMKKHISDFVDHNGEPVRGVEVVDLIPGMPAEDVLRIGDVMVSIEDEPLEIPSQVSSLIKQYWPGDEVELEIARDEMANGEEGERRSRRIRIRIKLGSTDQLVQQNRNSRFANSDRHLDEKRVYEYYQLHGPKPRLLNPPGNDAQPMQVSSMPMGFDIDLILQQLVADREAVLEKRPDAMSTVEFTEKWTRYSQDISIILQQNSFSDQDRLTLENLVARIIESVSLEP